jgi:glycosyltransferase involved in cell wall biosynthesis
MAFSHTFVVPSHNQAKFLPATIDALLAQEEPSQIVISEDFSTDESPQIAEAYASKHPDRIRVTRPREHKGMFPNWNWGIGLVETEWATIMGADDVALPNFSRTIREGAAKSDKTIVVCADWDFIDGDDKFLFSEKVLTLPEVARPPQTFYQLLPANKIHPAAHAFRFDAWKKVGGFPERLAFYGDWAFWLTLSPHGDTVHMRRTVSRYRVAYRPGIVVARMHQQFADEVFMQTELIPSLARQIPNVRMDLLHAAGWRRLRHSLHHITKDAPPEERPGIARIVEPWASNLGPRARGLVERFARGDEIPLDWFETWVRQPARRVYKALRR